MCLLRPACINESQFPLLISNVTINLPLSAPDPTFQLTTTQEKVTPVTITHTKCVQHFTDNGDITFDSGSAAEPLTTVH